MSPVLTDAISSVNPIVPISVCARRMADKKNIKSMYPKFVPWDALPQFMLDIPWGAMQFRENHRLIKNFEASQIVGFDFDNGLQTLDGIIEILNCAELPCHVGVTKSHRKPKGADNLVADRFRVALLMESVTNDADLYRQQLLNFRNIWSTNGRCWFDNSCVDPARLFYPCTEIVYSQSGSPLQWVVKKTPIKQDKKVTPTRDFKNVPNWVYRRVKIGPEDKSRHSIAYSAAAELSKHGFELDEVVSFLMSGYLPSGIGEYDVREAAWYGFNRGKGIENRNGAVDFASAGGRLRKGDR